MRSATVLRDGDTMRLLLRYVRAHLIHARGTLPREYSWLCSIHGYMVLSVYSLPPELMPLSSVLLPEEAKVHRRQGEIILPLMFLLSTRLNHLLLHVRNEDCYPNLYT